MIAANLPATVKAAAEQKWCSHCEAYRPVHAFAKDKKTPDGLNAWCKHSHRVKFRERTGRAELTPDEVLDMLIEAMHRAPRSDAELATQNARRRERQRAKPRHCESCGRRMAAYNRSFECYACQEAA